MRHPGWTDQNSRFGDPRSCGADRPIASGRILPVVQTCDICASVKACRSRADLADAGMRNHRLCTLYKPWLPEDPCTNFGGRPAARRPKAWLVRSLSGVVNVRPLEEPSAWRRAGLLAIERMSSAQAMVPKVRRRLDTAAVA